MLQSTGEDDFPCANRSVPYRTRAGRDVPFAAHGDNFNLLLGRRTYDMWSDFWPQAPSSPFAEGLNAATRYVATHRPESLHLGPAEALGSDIDASTRRAKSQDGGDLILAGSSTLTSTVLEHGLAEEVLLVVYPVLPGTGKRFVAERTPARSLELVRTTAMPSGIVLDSHMVVGALKTG